MLATVPVAKGAATYPVPATTPAGTRQIAATFVPSATPVVGSTSAVVPFTVDKAVSTTGLTATSQKVKATAPPTYELTMTAVVALNTARPPVGTVRFLVDGVQVAQAGVGADGRATVIVNTEKEKLDLRAEFVPDDTANHLGSSQPDGGVQGEVVG